MLIVPYSALLDCTVQMVARVLDFLGAAHVSCERVRRAVDATQFDALRDALRNSTDAKLSAADPAFPRESAKFRLGKAFAAHRDLSREAFETASAALDALRPEVRRVFHTSHAPCFVLGSAAPPEAATIHASATASSPRLRLCEPRSEASL